MAMTFKCSCLSTFKGSHQTGFARVHICTAGKLTSQSSIQTIYNMHLTLSSSCIGLWLQPELCAPVPVQHF